MNKIAKKEKTQMLPKEMIKEFIGKVCYVAVFDTSLTSYMKILDVEDNWIKVVDDKGEVSLINGDMVKIIRIASEKHQKKFEK